MKGKSLELDIIKSFKKWHNWLYQKHLSKYTLGLYIFTLISTQTIFT